MAPAITKYREDQPRVPAGSPEGGRFTDADGGGSVWSDPGDKPNVPLPSDIDTWESERAIAFLTERREETQRWSTEVARGVATGRLSADEAFARGWNPNIGRGVIGPLPERLFHATVALDAIRETGLKTQSEMAAAGIGSRGLGGGTDDTISLTSDRAYAERIAEVVAESRAVARGDISERDLIERATEGGFANRLKVFYETSSGDGGYERLARGVTVGEMAGLPRSREQMVESFGDRGWRLAEGASTITGTDGVERATPRSWERPLTDDERQDERFSLYRSFLLAQSEAGGPTDPVFWMPDPKYYAALDPTQIGVVEVTPRPGAVGYYLGESESEWRTWSGEALDVRSTKTVTASLVKEFDPDQPRDEAGRWTATGAADGGSTDEKPAADAPTDRWRDLPYQGWHGVRHLTDERIESTVERLARNVTSFAAAGGQVISGPFTDAALARLVDTIDPNAPNANGAHFAMVAMSEGYQHLNVALDKDGNVVGAHGYDAHQSNAELGSRDWLYGFGIFGTTGDIAGAGAALVAQYLDHAARYDAAVAISPVPEAMDFWAKMGMLYAKGKHGDWSMNDEAAGDPDDSGWGMSAGDVQRVWMALQDARGGTVTKQYDPNQPRDERGRWTDEGGWYEAADLWTSSPWPERLRNALTNADPERSYWGRQARSLLAHTYRQPPTEQPLYRGVRLNAFQRGDIARLKPGDSFDIHLTSWADSHASAIGWTSNRAGQIPARIADEAVATAVFTLEPGARALDISDITNRNQSEGGYYKFSEWLTAGRFEVVGVTEQRDGAHYEVTLRQTGTLAPKELRYAFKTVRINKYREDQERGDDGRWVDEGAGRDVIVLDTANPRWGVDREVLPQPTLPNLHGQWYGQAEQHPATADPGFHARTEHVEGQIVGDISVNIITHYGDDRSLDGILYHYPDGAGRLEQPGAITVLVNPERQRQGIGTSLLDQFEQRYGPIDWGAQSFSPSGRNMALSYLRSRGQTDKMALVARAPLRKYREDQARGDDGRWVDEGGEAGASITTGTGPYWDDAPAGQDAGIGFGADRAHAALDRAIDAVGPAHGRMTDGAERLIRDGNVISDALRSWRADFATSLAMRVIAEGKLPAPAYQNNLRTHFLAYALRDAVGAATSLGSESWRIEAGAPRGREGERVTFSMAAVAADRAGAERYGPSLVSNVVPGAGATLYRFPPDAGGIWLDDPKSVRNEAVTSGEFVVDSVVKDGDKWLVTLADATITGKAAEWREEDHPRHPAGSSEGGRFAPADGGGTTADQDDAETREIRQEVIDSLPTMHGSTRDMVADIGVNLRESFPGIRTDFLMADNPDISVAAWVTAGDKSIRFNRMLWGEDGLPVLKSIVESSEADGWSAVKGLEGIVYHEFGHVLMNHIADEQMRNPESPFVQADSAAGAWFGATMNAKFGHDVPDPVIALVTRFLDPKPDDVASIYGTLNKHMGIVAYENWAEWCAIAFTPGNPRYNEPQALDIRRTLADAGIYQPDVKKMMVRKYREDQERIPAGETGGGRWTSESSYFPVPRSEYVSTAVGQWSESDRKVASIREEITSGVAFERWPPSYTHPGMYGLALAAAVAHGRTAPTLYRGTAVHQDDEQTASRWLALRPGDTFDLNLTGWSELEDVAQHHATWREGSGPQRGLNVLLVCEDATGLRAWRYGGHDYPNEREWITDGRFRVLDVQEHNEWWVANGAKGLTIRVSQEAVFDAPTDFAGLAKAATRIPFDEADFGWVDEALGEPMRAKERIVKYRDDQLRDDNGRWATEGGDSAEPDRDSHAWKVVASDIDGHGMGNCYPAALTLAIRSSDLGLRNVTVCHGTVTPRFGKLKDFPFSHAWLEADGPNGTRVAYDYSSKNRVAMEATAYRELGRIAGITEYARMEAMKKAVESGHYGPWDE